MMTLLFFLSVNFCEDLQTSDDDHTEPKNVNVMLCGDEDYLAPIAVALTSLSENANQNIFFSVFILVPGNLRAEIKVKMNSLQEKYKNMKINFVDMGGSFQTLSAMWPGIHFGYLKAASLLPDIKKTIFLDGDLVVRHDLLELYNTNIDDYYVAGVREASMDVGKKGDKKFLGLTDFSKYINSGVILLNLEKIREDGLERKFLKFITMQKKYIRNRKLGGVQDIINTICYKKILLLPLKFNVQVNTLSIHEPYEKNKYALRYSTHKDWKEAKDPTIAHFSWKPKPWIDPKKTIYHVEFWNYAKKSVFFEQIQKMNSSRHHLPRNVNASVSRVDV